MFGIRISRRFMLALGVGIVRVATNPADLHAWMDAVGIVAAAAASGVQSSKPAAQ